MGSYFVRFMTVIILVQLLTCSLSIDPQPKEVITDAPDLVHVLGEANANDTLISDTLDLLKYGDENIVLLEEYKDVVLVVGNTDAGKSTLTKFITGNNSQLISYFTPGGFIIMDPEGEISNSTIVSQSLLPTLMIHNESNLAFYDMPGFSDIRNVSVEIANAFFMKKVANHAEKVKLLFVVNYASLTPGGYRYDFLKMARQSVDFVKNVEKFQDSISLISTKVNNPWNDTLVISGIVYFLETALYDLPNLISDEDERQMVTSLIHSFIIQLTTPLVDSDDPFARIAPFRVPDREGPVSEIPVIMDSKPLMQQIIWNNTKFVEKQDSDFGLSLSGDAQFIVGEAVSKLKSEVGNALLKLGQVIGEAYQDRIERMMTSGSLNESYYLLNDLHWEYNLFVDMIKKLNDSSLTRAQFLEILQKTLVSNIPPMSISNVCSPVFEEILELSDKLGFFETILEELIPAPTADWLLTMSSVKDLLGFELINFITSKISPEIDAGLSKFSVALNSLLISQYPNDFYLVSALQPLIDNDYKVLLQITSQMAPAKTLAELALTPFYLFDKLSVTIFEKLPVFPAPGLNVDLDDLQSNLYPIGSWTKIFEPSMIHLTFRREYLTSQHKSEIRSPQSTNWGSWGNYDDCDPGSMVSGMKLRVDHTVSNMRHIDHNRTTEFSGLHGQVTPFEHCYSEPGAPARNGDMTGLNSIQFFCSKAGESSDAKIKMITSKEGSKGDWGFELKCSDRKKAIGFEVRTEKPRGNYCWTEHHYCCWASSDWWCNGCGWGEMGKWDCWDTNECVPHDETSVNNLNLICEDQVVLGGNGENRGDWTGRQVCPPGQFLCGIQTQVQDPGSADGTGLNNLKARCCNIFN